MSILYPGEFLVQQFDDVTITKQPNYWCHLWHNFSYLNKAWKAKVTFKQQLSESFQCSVILTNFRFLVFERQETAFLKLATGDIISICIYMQLPLNHFRYIYRTSNSNQVIFSGLLPFNFMFSFKTSLPIEVFDFINSLNSNKVTPFLFCFHHSVCKRNPEKQQKAPKLNKQDLDPLQSSKSIGNNSMIVAGHKTLSFKPNITAYSCQWSNYYNCYEQFSFIDAHPDLLEGLFRVTAKSETLNSIRTMYEQQLPVENFDCYLLPISQILPFDIFKELNLTQDTTQIHLSFKNLNYQICATYPAVIPLATEEIISSAKNFQFCRYPALVNSKILRSGKLIKSDDKLQFSLVQILARLKQQTLVVVELGDSGFCDTKLSDNLSIVTFNSQLPNTDALQSSYKIIFDVAQNSVYQQARCFRPSNTSNIDLVVDEMTNYIQKQQKIQRDEKNNSKIELSNWNLYVHEFLLVAAKVVQYSTDSLVLLSGHLERFYAPLILFFVSLYINDEARTIAGFIKNFKLHFQYFGFPLTSLYSESPHRSFTQMHGHVQCPIMQLFLDCVMCLMKNYSNSFGFTFEFVIHFVFDLFNGQYGDFLFDCEAETLGLVIPTLTESLLSAPTKKYERYQLCEDELEPIDSNLLESGIFANDGVLSPWFQVFSQ